jgi:hypothetical protein
MTVKTKRPTTLFAISFDLDSYLANGGAILDLVLPSVADEARIEAAVRMAKIPPDRVARFGEFLKRVGKVGPANAAVGSALSEARLQRIWRATA